MLYVPDEFQGEFAHEEEPFQTTITAKATVLKITLEGVAGIYGRKNFVRIDRLKPIRTKGSK